MTLPAAAPAVSRRVCCCRGGQLAAFLQFGVLRRDGKAMFERLTPDLQIVGSFETRVADVARLRKHVGQ